MYWNLVCRQVQMGVNGCAWVRMSALGRRGHVGHENKVKGGELWSRRPWFGIYGRGNFPEHHVLPNKSKMGANGPGWVRRGSHGCNRVYLHGGERKQGETRQKPAIGTCFSGVRTGNKTSLSWQGQSRGSERIQGGNCGRPTGERYDIDVYAYL